MGNVSKWKEFLMERTVSRQHRNLMQVVYEEPATVSASVNQGKEQEDSEEEEFFKPKLEGRKVNLNFDYVNNILSYLNTF